MPAMSRNMEDELREKFIIIDEEYLRKYLTICSISDSSAYTEEHHILPKSIWPEYKDLKVHTFNSVRLTRVNHALAHYYFSKATGKRWDAVMLLVNPGKKRISKAVKMMSEHEIIKLSELHQKVLEEYDFLGSLSSAEIIEWKKKVSDGVKKMWDNMPSEEKERRVRKSKEKRLLNAKPVSDITREKLRVSVRLGRNSMSSEKKRQEILNKRLVHRKGEHWNHYLELFALWQETGMKGFISFRGIAKDNGYPYTKYGYETMVKQFKEDLCQQ